MMLLTVGCRQGLGHNVYSERAIFVVEGLRISRQQQQSIKASSRPSMYGVVCSCTSCMPKELDLDTGVRAVKVYSRFLSYRKDEQDGVAVVFLLVSWEE